MIPFPTAMHVAAARAVDASLLPALRKLEASLWPRRTRSRRS